VTLLVVLVLLLVALRGRSFNHAARALLQQWAAVVLWKVVG
jgi:hypothetical protein